MYEGTPRHGNSSWCGGCQRRMQSSLELKGIFGTLLYIKELETTSPGPKGWVALPTLREICSFLERLHGTCSLSRDPVPVVIARVRLVNL